MKNENLINFGIVNYEIKNSTFNWPNFGEVHIATKFLIELHLEI